MTFSQFIRYTSKASIRDSGVWLCNPEDIRFFREKGSHVKYAIDRRSLPCKKSKGTGYWKVKPIYATHKDVYIICPFCGQVHRHSVKDGPRIPQCGSQKIFFESDDFSIYWLIKTEKNLVGEHLHKT